MAKIEKIKLPTNKEIKEESLRRYPKNPCDHGNHNSIKYTVSGIMRREFIKTCNWLKAKSVMKISSSEVTNRSTQDK